MGFCFTGFSLPLDVILSDKMHEIHFQFVLEVLKTDCIQYGTLLEQTQICEVHIKEIFAMNIELEMHNRIHCTQFVFTNVPLLQMWPELDPGSLCRKSIFVKVQLLNLLAVNVLKMSETSAVKLYITTGPITCIIPCNLPIYHIYIWWA